MKVHLAERNRFGYAFCMHSIPEYPGSSPLVLEHLDSVQPFLLANRDHISELSMASLYPFTAKRDYRVFRYTKKDNSIAYGFIAKGTASEEMPLYAFLPAGYPGPKIIESLMKDVAQINTIGQQTLPSWEQGVHSFHPELVIEEDRDNADYLYDRQSLVELVGQALHKKLAHAQKFADDNPQRILVPARLCDDRDMLEVLHSWAEGKDTVEDLDSTALAIQYRKELGMDGAVLYAKDKPVAFTLGEADGQNRFIIHIEKAVPGYRGVYQYINRAFAASLPESIIEINREQDLGIPGLRQAKLTYKPSSYVMKYKIRKTL